MKKLGLNEIREKFLSFYQTKEHYRRNSFSLVPNNDKSLLIINSGMAPLKPFFAGLETPPAPRMTTCQKCIRTDDIENVGVTSRHGTFFEMLGSFSFADYFKEESITWGWEFVTRILEIPEEKVWVTVYLDDDEAFNIWKNKIGVPAERIVRLGKDDNFWEIGTGPCGPCSEIYFDRGEEYGCGSPDCKPGCDCDRYLEFWNHVFTQFDCQEDGTYAELAHKNIDTGMGLERMACIMQGVDSIFDVDTIRLILDEVCKIANVKYEDGKAKTDISVRVITDHIRSATFMISDTIVPSNEGRGYVLRRLIRRAVRHGRMLGIEGKFLSKLVDKVLEASGAAYPELIEQEVFIKKIIDQEEDRFSKTLKQGLHIMEEYMQELKATGKTVFDGEKAFKLHDTYGFPFEITQEILEENGFSVDKEDFEKHMLAQKQLGKNDAAKSDEGWKENPVEQLNVPKTLFEGYSKNIGEMHLLGMIKDGTEITKAQNGEEVLAVFDKTPFYATSGGQKCDVGILKKCDLKVAEVLEVTKTNDIFIHKIKITSDELLKDEMLFGNVHIKNRNNGARNHTATHLLHQALRNALGEHIHQAGSQVDAKTLRFDFAHYEAVDSETLQKVEKEVNDIIAQFMDVKCQEMPIADAKETGAIGLFEDKYGDTVRVVSIGDYSKELCGGIHVANTGQIGGFKILSESGIAAGVRRIEAITGAAIVEALNTKEKQLLTIANKLKTKPNLLDEKIDNFLKEKAEMEVEIASIKQSSLNTMSEELLDGAVLVNNGVRLVTKQFNNLDVKELKSLADEIRANNEDVALIFTTSQNGKNSLVVALAKKIVTKGYKAGDIVKKLVTVLDGRGGGRPDMAQAGFNDITKINEAFELANKLF